MVPILIPHAAVSSETIRARIHDHEERLSLATSVGGVLTGRGADFIIIDDPLKPDEALSETQRNAVNEWFDHTLYSRLNDKRTGCIIIITQRLHEDDLVGHVLEQEDWEILCDFRPSQKKTKLTSLLHLTARAPFGDTSARRFIRNVSRRKLWGICAGR